VFLIAVTADAQSPVSTRHWSGQGIAPVYEGFEVNADGTFNMWFGSDRVPAAGGDIVITSAVRGGQYESACLHRNDDGGCGGTLPRLA
jgi:hypothetical protein